MSRREWIAAGLGLLLFVACLLTGCSVASDSVFTVKISGTGGLRFSGTYMTITSGGESSSATVEGTVPAQYTTQGQIVSCVFQKQSEFGTLRIEVVKEGKVVSQSETSAAYGAVSVATR